MSDSLTTITSVQSTTHPKPNIPGYDISGPLGEGGMGVVWHATQIATKREVALKVMSQSYIGSHKARSRFVREVELAARLQHHNIALVYDSGVVNGLCYYAMEYIEGDTLDVYLSKHTPDIVSCVHIMRRISRAVAYAHSRGVIHRDLKPRNIIVSSDDQPHIVDFGLAKTPGHGQDNQITMTGEVAGTPAFMAPEQAKGDLYNITTATDVYALGVIFYHMLTGAHPNGESQSLRSILENVIHKEAIPPTRINKSIPPDLESIVMQCLVKDHESRYPDAGDLHSDLKRFLVGDPISARSITLRYIISKNAKKHWKIASGIAAVLMLFAVGAGYSSYAIIAERENALDSQAIAEERLRELEQNQAALVAAREQAIAALDKADQEKQKALLLAENERKAKAVLEEQQNALLLAQQQAKEASERADEQKDVTQQTQADLLKQKYFSQIVFASNRLAMNDFSMANTALLNTDETYRHWEHDWLISQTDMSIATLNGHSSPTFLVEFFHDASRLVSVSQKKMVIWDINSKQPLDSIREGHIGSAVISSDDRHIVYCASNRGTSKTWHIRVYDLENRRFVKQWTEEFATSGTPTCDISSDGNRILVSMNASDNEADNSGANIIIYDLSRSSTSREQIKHAVDYVRFSRNDSRGQSISAYSRHKVRQTTNEYTKLTEYYLSRGLKQNPSTKEFYLPTLSSSLDMVNPYYTRYITIPERVSGLRTNQFKQRRIQSNHVIASQTHGIIMDLKDSSLTDYPSLKLRYSESGEHIIGTDGSSIRLWDSETGVPTRWLRHHDSEVLATHIHPTSNMAASSDASGQIKLWQLDYTDQPITIEVNRSTKDNLQLDNFQLSDDFLSASALVENGNARVFTAKNSSSNLLKTNQVSAVSSDGRFAVTRYGNAEDLKKLLDVNQEQTVLPDIEINTYCSFGRNSRYLYMLSDSKGIEVYDCVTKKYLLSISRDQFERDNLGMPSRIFHDDKDRSCIAVTKSAIMFFSVDNKTPVRKIPISSEMTIKDIEVCPDGRTAAVLTQEKVHVFDFARGEVVQNLAKDRKVATQTAEVVYVYDIQEAKRLRRLPLKSPSHSVHFLYDQDRLMTLSTRPKGNILWDVQAQLPIVTVNAPGQIVDVDTESGSLLVYDSAAGIVDFMFLQE